jgi:hypothetical protein
MKLRGAILAGAMAFAFAVPAAAQAATFEVNTTGDTLSAGACAAATPAQCSLREAVIESNATPPAAGQSNTINVPAGTYTLTRTGAANADGPIAFNAQNNELDIEVNTKILGAGAGEDPSQDTIVQAGTTATNGISLIFIVNGYTNLANVKPLDATLQGMTLQFGRNHYIASGAAWGYGGAVEYESGDGGQLTLTNDLITQNSTTDGDGGGVAVFDTPSPQTSNRSLTSISNSTISDNTSVEPEGGGQGGGVFAGTPEPLVVSGSTITGNSAVNGSSCTNHQCSNGGGLLEFGPNLTVAGSTPSSITNSTISNNSAALEGGGLNTERAITISGTTFSGNALTNAGTPTLGGGGGLYSAVEPNSTSVTGSTFTGNDAGAGHGGAIVNDGGTLTLTSNRITGNTAAAATGLDQDSNVGTVAVANATEDWWGCNGGPGAAGCDTVANQNTTAGSSFTTSPFVTLRTTASPTTILAGGSSTLTTSFLKDSAGSTLSTGQISELIGLPVVWTNAIHGAFSNQQTTIQSGGTATATLTNDNTCNNTSGQSKVDNVQTGDSLATATLTTQCPDFSVAKTNDVSGTTSLGGHWTWKLHIANGGAVSGTFPSGATVVSDDLPSSGLTYGTASVSNATGVSGTGTLTCSIASNTLTCTASGGPVVVASPGSFDVTFTATPSTAGTFANPRTSGVCGVDPGGSVPESNEGNNACSNSVVVTAPDLTVAKSDDVSGATTLGSGWNWKLHVANGGSGDATFASGQTVLSDDLPNANVAYGTPSVSGQAGISGTGTLSCSIAADTLTCTASGGTVIVGSATGAFDVSVAATPSRTGTFTNPRSGGSCSVDPGNAITESSESNNACNSDTVAVTAPDLTATKTDDVSGTTAVGSSFNWKIHVVNGGDAPATFASGATVLTDDLPTSGLSYGAASISGTSGISGTGTLACSITTNTLSCTASGGTVVLGASTGAFDVSFSATPTVAQTFANPRSGGTCAVDPGTVIAESDETNNACSDSVLVTGADLTATKTDDVGGTTTLGNHWTWNIHVANTGVSDATFSDGQTVLTDDLPPNANYGAATVSNATGVTGTGTVSCSMATNTLTCTASGGSVVIGASTGAFDVSFTVTPTQAGTFANPRSAGSCSVDPHNVIPESDETNNGCSDTVVVTAPDLTAVKTNDVSGTAVLGGHWIWSIQIANGGNADATFADGKTILTDDLPSSNVNYGTPTISGATGITGAANISCSISVTDTLTCVASGGSVKLASGTGAFNVSFTATPSATGTFANPRAGGSCAVDPGGVVTESDTADNSCSNTVTVNAPDLTATKTDDVGGATTLGQHWTWKIHVANTGSGDATFASGQTVLRDDLPNANIAYGTASVSNASGVSGTGELSCSIASSTLTCTASGGSVVIGASTGAFDVSFTATPSAIGTFANPRSGGSCSVDPATVLSETDTTNNACSDTVSVSAADLTATKSDNVSGATTLGNPWTWKIHLANLGNADATFADGKTILTDDLPSSTISYGTATVSGATGVTGGANVSCSISGGDTLTCVASGGPVTLASGTGAFDVSVTATPSAIGTFANPRSGGSCATDPGNVVAESNEANNSCSDTVIVSNADLTATKTDDTGGATTLGKSWTWNIHVANAGGSDATFNSGDTVLTDDLPNANITYGTATIANATGVSGTGTLSCSVASSTLTCTASGGTVIIGASTGAFDVSVDATPTAVGTFANPRAGGTCSVNPGHAVPEANMANNSCSDSVTVTEPDLTATKTNDVSGVTTLGQHWTWKIHVANSGSGDATFASGQTVLRDDLPNANVAYGTATISNTTGVSGTGTLSCSIASSTLTCTASGGTVVIGASTGAFDVSFTATPSAPGTFANPRSGGACSVDPGGALVEASTTNNSCSDTVTVSAPDLTASKTNDVGGATTLGHNWTWKIHVANAGTADATFASGQKVLSDDLPNTSIAYGSAAVANAGGLTGTGTLSCSIASSTLTCTASSGSVTIAPTAGFDVSFTATPSAGGSFANPRSGGVCKVDPAGVTGESNTANNSCHDTVNAGASPTVALTTPPDGAHYNLSQHVLAAYGCQEGPGGPGLQSCSGTVANGAAIDTATAGTHAFKATATSTDGLSTIVTHSYVVVGPPKAIISSPSTGLTFRRGQRVLTRFSCLEAAGGPGLSSCLDSHRAQPPSGRLDTSRKGTFTYTVTAVSKDGQRGTASLTYRVKNGEPDNHFTISGVHFHRDGSAQFETTTPGAGQIDVLETAWHNNEVVRSTVLLQPAVHRFVFARTHSRSSRKGNVQISIHPNTRGVELIKHHHYVVQIRLWITFTPRGGRPRSRGFYGLFITR